MHELLGWLFSGRQWSLPVLGLRQGFLHGQHWRCELRRVCRWQVLRRRRRHLMHELRSGHLSVQDRTVCVLELRCRKVLLCRRSRFELLELLCRRLSGEHGGHELRFLPRWDIFNPYGGCVFIDLFELCDWDVSVDDRCY